MAEFSFTYRAFISYSHSDHKHAVSLHKALERYRVPRRLAGADGRKRLGRVFRDEEELGAAAELGPKIEAALKSSDVLIVVCSPRSARSEWVNKEIEAFKRHGRETRVFAVVVEGKPHGSADPAAEDAECFPPALKVTADGGVAEPLAVDVRKFGREDAVLRLIAGMLDVGYDDLRQREVRRRRAEMFRAQAILATGLVLTAGALAGGWFAASNYVDASEKKSALFAREADALTRDGDGSKALLMALYGDPAAGATWVERILRPEGYRDARHALTRAFTGDRAALVLQHDGQRVLSVAYAPSGAKLATGDATGARIWSADKGEQIATFAGGLYVNAMAFSPDGAMVAVATGDGGVSTWAAGAAAGAVEAPSATFAGHENGANSVSYSPDGEFLASSGVGGELHVSRASDGVLVASLKDAHTGLALSSVSFSPAGRRLLSTGYDGEARLWRLEQSADGAFSLASDGVIPTSVSLSGAFSPDGRKVIVASDDEVQQWDVSVEGAPPRKIDVYQSHDKLIYSVAYSKDGQFFATASGDGTAKLWLANGELSPQATLEGHSSGLVGVTFSPDGKTLLTGSMDGTARATPIPAKAEAVEFRVAPKGRAMAALSPDGQRVVVAAAGEAVLWTVADNREIARIKTSDGTVRNVAFSPDGAKVLLTGSTGRMDIWTPGAGAAGGEQVRSFKVHDGEINAAVWAGDSLRVVTGSKDQSVKVWSSEDGAVLSSALLKRTVRSVAVSPDSSMVMIGVYEAPAMMWRIGESGGPAPFGDARENSHVVAFSPDGKRIVTSSYVGPIKIWPLSGDAPDVTIVRAFGDNVMYSPDGKLILVSTESRTAIFSAAGGAALEVFDPGLELYGGWGLSASFGPDSNAVLLGSYLGKARFWPIDPFVLASKDKQVELACARMSKTTGQSFTEEDYASFPILERNAPHPCAAVWGGAGQ